MKNPLNQAHCWVLRDQLVRVGFLGPHTPTNHQVHPVRDTWQARELMWDRTYFENFTVDASIFVVTTSY